MATHLLAGILLAILMIVSLIFSGFIIFTVVTSQLARTVNNLLLFQLGFVNLLLAITFLAFSAPSLLQDKWLAARFSNNNNSDNIDILSNEESRTLSKSLMITTTPITKILPTDLIQNEYRETYSSAYVLDSRFNSFNLDNYSYVEYSDLAKMALNSNDNSNNESIVLGYSHNSITVYGKGIKPFDQIPIGEGLFCQIYGSCLLTLHVAAVWLIVGIQCDKFCAISAPLRYSTLVTRRKIAIYSFLVWSIAIMTVVYPLATAQVYIYVGGACLPAWHVHGSLPYIICLAATTLLIPGIFIIVINAKIVIIARRHQHKIFSAIFEVMMSAQATVTHQKNPFDVPKKKQKSTRSVIEQLLAFFICYCPLFVVAFWETFVQKRINVTLETIGVGTFLAAPLVNSFLYGIKCKLLRKAFKNYLRKRLYKSEVKSEIEARISSGQNSRRPSMSSSIGMPFIHRSLKRRMSDYLMKDLIQDEIERQGRIARRSSDLSWHPLEDGTPSPNRLRKPLNVNIPSNLAATSPTSVSQYLKVPSFEAARYYCQGSQKKDVSSTLSIDSDCVSEIDHNDSEEEAISIHGSSYFLTKNNKLGYQQIPLCLESREDNCGSPTLEDSPPIDTDVPCSWLTTSVSEGKYSENSIFSELTTRSSCTPLFISAYEKVYNTDKPVNTTSPYIARTIDALTSIGFSQSLLKTSSMWRQKSKESLNKMDFKPKKCAYVSVPIEIYKNNIVEEKSDNYREMLTFNNHVKPPTIGTKSPAETTIDSFPQMTKIKTNESLCNY